MPVECSQVVENPIFRSNPTAIYFGPRAVALVLFLVKFDTIFKYLIFWSDIYEVKLPNQS
jgi:hypothetical protein